MTTLIGGATYNDQGYIVKPGGTSPSGTMPSNVAPPNSNAANLIQQIPQNANGVNANVVAANILVAAAGAANNNFSPTFNGGTSTSTTVPGGTSQQTLSGGVSAGGGGSTGGGSASGGVDKAPTTTVVKSSPNVNIPPPLAPVTGELPVFPNAMAPSVPSFNPFVPPTFNTPANAYGGAPPVMRVTGLGGGDGGPIGLPAPPQLKANQGGVAGGPGGDKDNVTPELISFMRDILGKPRFEGGPQGQAPMAQAPIMQQPGMMMNPAAMNVSQKDIPPFRGSDESRAKYLNPDGTERQSFAPPQQRGGYDNDPGMSPPVRNYDIDPGMEAPPQTKEQWQRRIAQAMGEASTPPAVQNELAQAGRAGAAAGFLANESLSGPIQLPPPDKSPMMPGGGVSLPGKLDDILNNFENEIGKELAVNPDGIGPDGMPEVPAVYQAKQEMIDATNVMQQLPNLYVQRQRGLSHFVDTNHALRMEAEQWVFNNLNPQDQKVLKQGPIQAKPTAQSANAKLSAFLGFAPGRRGVGLTPGEAFQNKYYEAVYKNYKDQVDDLVKRHDEGQKRMDQGSQENLTGLRLSTQFSAAEARRKYNSEMIDFRKEQARKINSLVKKAEYDLQSVKLQDENSRWTAMSNLNERKLQLRQIMDGELAHHYNLMDSAAFERNEIARNNSEIAGERAQYYGQDVGYRTGEGARFARDMSTYKNQAQGDFYNNQAGYATDPNRAKQAPPAAPQRGQAIMNRAQVYEMLKGQNVNPKAIPGMIDQMFGKGQ